MSQSATAQSFQREERYIVIKRKHLTPEIETILRDEMHDLRISTVECVVVESDWPEYETVWKMIEDRVTGGISSTPTAEPDEALKGIIYSSMSRDFERRYTVEPDEGLVDTVLNAIVKSGKVEAMDRHNLTMAFTQSIRAKALEDAAKALAAERQRAERAEKLLADITEEMIEAGSYVAGRQVDLNLVHLDEDRQRKILSDIYHAMNAKRKEQK